MISITNNNKIMEIKNVCRDWSRWAGIRWAKIEWKEKEKKKNSKIEYYNKKEKRGRKEICTDLTCWMRLLEIEGQNVHTSRAEASLQSLSMQQDARVYIVTLFLCLAWHFPRRIFYVSSINKNSWTSSPWIRNTWTIRIYPHDESRPRV